MNLESLQYPIGKFTPPSDITESILLSWVDDIQNLPAELRMTTSSLSDEELNTPYRPGGWTKRQVIHHLADSHLNSYIRFKLAVTEDNPIIRPYFEDRWAECEEAKNADINISLNLLESLHKRWVLFLKSLNRPEWEKTFYHPENKKTSTLKETAGVYAWHGKHHLAHLLINKG